MLQMKSGRKFDNYTDLQLICNNEYRYNCQDEMVKLRHGHPYGTNHFCSSIYVLYQL
jgi:hypothetical protein